MRSSTARWRRHPIIATVPALILMAFGQRFLVRGLTLGAVK